MVVVLLGYYATVAVLANEAFKYMQRRRCAATNVLLGATKLTSTLLTLTNKC